MKFNLKLEKEFRRQFCHKCHHYFLPGKNVSIKLNPKTKAVEYKCKDCSHVNRYPYAREKKAKA